MPCFLLAPLQVDNIYAKMFLFMENITFNLMKFPEDKAEINGWQTKFAKTAGWDNIYKYILENGLIRSLDEVILTNYEIFPIGDDEIKLALSIKNQKETLGFVICQEFNLTTPSPELFLQYIVLRPDMQNKGIGKQIFNKLPTEIEKITGKRPQSAFSYIDCTNLPSQKLYKRFEFDLSPINHKFVKATGNFEPQLEK